MPEWLIERGIGETRAALVEDGEIIEARIELDGVTPAGSVLERAGWSNTGISGRNAVAVASDGDRISAARGAAGRHAGRALTIEVTREAIPGAEPWKRPLARLTDEADCRAARAARGRRPAFPGVPTTNSASWAGTI